MFFDICEQSVKVQVNRTNAKKEGMQKPNETTYLYIRKQNSLVRALSSNANKLEL